MYIDENAVMINSRRYAVRETLYLVALCTSMAVPGAGSVRSQPEASADPVSMSSRLKTHSDENKLAYRLKDPVSSAKKPSNTGTRNSVS